jgi:bifunctional non-homologous end joining protein LigD
VVPQAPTLVREPFHRDGWVYEEKVDGSRILAASAISKLSARSLVLAGEVAIYDQQLRSRFDGMREPDPDAVATPPLLMAFDLLYQDRRDLTGRQLRDRRARLEDVVAGSELFFRVRRLAPDGVQAWAQVVQRGYEGYVAKDPASVYEGGPTRRWLKVKQKDWTVAEDGWRRESAPGSPVTGCVRHT